eukprot:1355880-Prymnesium_polylepis.2
MVMVRPRGLRADIGYGVNNQYRTWSLMWGGLCDTLCGAVCDGGFTNSVNPVACLGCGGVWARVLPVIGSYWCVACGRHGEPSTFDRHAMNLKYRFATHSRKFPNGFGRIAQ